LRPLRAPHLDSLRSPFGPACGCYCASLRLFACPRKVCQRRAPRHPGFAALNLIRSAHPTGQPFGCYSASLRFLAPAPLRGPAYMGRPWPIKRGRHRYFAASMRLVPLRTTSTRPPDGTGARACNISKDSSSAASVFAVALELRSHRRHPSPLQEAEWNRHVRGRAGSHERHGCRESCDGRGRLGRDGPSQRAPGVVMEGGNPGAAGRGRLARMVGCPSLWLLSLGQARAT
jgi:hypothetical protein